MKLADFILRDTDAILAEWEVFAAAHLPAAPNLGPAAMRDHAQQIMQAVALDLRSAQTAGEQQLRLSGCAPAPATETAAQAHAMLCARSGVDINQVAAGYRALRACVLTLWCGDIQPASVDLAEMVRFNEAIDQALAVAISHFSAEVERAHDLHLGTLGHDLRNPLQAIVTTAAYLARLDAGVEVTKAAARLTSTGGRIKALLDDLLDFNRSRLGLGLIIVTTATDLAPIVAEQLQQLRSAYPGRLLTMQVDGDTRGVWDANRLNQLLDNLIGNALRHGTVDGEVKVELRGFPTELLIVVRNGGAPIPPEALARLFDPLRGDIELPGPGADASAGGGRNDSLGIGLYIARQIVAAHGGEIGAQSDEHGTALTVRLPRVSTR